MSRRKLGPLFRRYRIKHKLMQKDAAAKLKISPAQLSKLEFDTYEPLGDLAIDILEIMIPGLTESIKAVSDSLLLIEAEEELKLMRRQ